MMISKDSLRLWNKYNLIQFAYEHSNAPYVELAVYSQPFMINRLDSAPEQCFVDVVKLEKVFCEINECKGDIYDGIRLNCHMRIGDKAAIYAITKEYINMMPYEEIVRCVSRAFDNHFKKGK